MTFDSFKKDTKNTHQAIDLDNLDLGFILGLEPAAFCHLEMLLISRKRLEKLQKSLENFPDCCLQLEPEEASL